MTLEPIQRFIDKLVEFKTAPDNPADEIDNIDKAQSIESLDVIEKYASGEIDALTFKAQIQSLISSQDVKTQSRAQLEGILRNCDNA
jgi:hypothetical protein